MKKTDISVSLRDGARKRLKQYSRLLSQSLSAGFLLLTLMWQNQAFGQADCSLSCHGAQVSLGADCTAEVTVAMIGETTQFPNGEFTVYVYTLGGDTVPTSPVVTQAEIGMTLIASVRDNISGNTFWIFPERCLWWEEENTLIVADLHLGKSGHFRKSGIAVPQDIYKADLQRLMAMLYLCKAERLIIAGDLTHSHFNRELDLFLKWRKEFAACVKLRYTLRKMPALGLPMDLQFAGYELKLRERQLIGPGGSVELSSRSFDILVALLARPNEMIEKSDLFDAAWPGVVVEENTLQVHVSSLRKILGPGYIATVHGRGYKYVGPLPQSVAADTTSAAERTSQKGNVPNYRAECVAREDELASLAALLAKHRITSIIGPGGVGKTTLAVEMAARQQERFSGGVWIVDLAPVGDPVHVGSTVGQTLGMLTRKSTAIENELAEYLRSEELLLVFDNCEHVLGAVGEVLKAILALSLIHISEPTRLLSISYAVFCLKTKKHKRTDILLPTCTSPHPILCNSDQQLT